MLSKCVLTSHYHLNEVKLKNRKFRKFLYFFSLLTWVLFLYNSDYYVSNNEKRQSIILLIITFIPVFNLFVIPLRLLAIIQVIFHDEDDEVELPIVNMWANSLGDDENLHTLLCYCSLLPWLIAFNNRGYGEEFDRNLYQGLIISLILFLPGMNLIGLLIDLWAIMVLLFLDFNIKRIRLPFVTALYEIHNNKMRVKKGLLPEKYSDFHSTFNKVEEKVFYVLLIINILAVLIFAFIKYGIPYLDGIMM